MIDGDYRSGNVYLLTIEHIGIHSSIADRMMRKVNNALRSRHGINRQRHPFRLMHIPAGDSGEPKEEESYCCAPSTLAAAHFGGRTGVVQ
jgi:hypothetical protein